jgi:hypothetical protein
MAQKKKNMDGGRIFGSIFNRKPNSSNMQVLNNSNVYLKQIKNLQTRYSIINPNNLSVNNLNTKVKSLIQFSKTIKNKQELMPLLEQVKETLIQKLLKKLEKYDRIFQEDPNLYNFSELLSILQDFEKLSDQIILLGGERNRIDPVKLKKNQFIATMLDKYEKEILQTNKNSQTLQKLKQEVLDYISKYSQFVVSIATKKGTNNSINTIIFRLSELYDNISKNSAIKNNSQQLKSQQNNSQQFKVNNHPKKLENRISQANLNKEEIIKIANQIFELLSRKFDLAIEFLDTIGNKKRITKRMNNSLVNNAVYENKDLAKNIKKLYDLWVNFTKWDSKYLWVFQDKDKLKLEKQASIIEDKKQKYSQKMYEKQIYVNYTE